MRRGVGGGVGGGSPTAALRSRMCRVIVAKHWMQFALVIDAKGESQNTDRSILSKRAAVALLLKHQCV